MMSDGQKLTEAMIKIEEILLTDSFDLDYKLELIEAEVRRVLDGDDE